MLRSEEQLGHQRRIPWASSTTHQVVMTVKMIMIDDFHLFSLVQLPFSVRQPQDPQWQILFMAVSVLVRED